MTQEQSEFIAQIYLEMYNKLFEYARSSLPYESLAEEAVQDTFRIACQKPDDLLNSPNPNGWLMNVLKYVICNIRKNQAVGRKILEQYYRRQADELAKANDTEDVSLLYHDMASMEDFQLLHEMAIEGKSYLEMSKTHGISVTACRKRVQRARERLQKKLKI